MTSRVLSCPYTVPVIARDVHKRPADSFGRHSASPPVPARPARPSVGRRESGGKSRRRLALSSGPTWSASRTAVPMSGLPLQAWDPQGAIRTTDTGADRLAQLAVRSWPAGDGIGEPADATHPRRLVDRPHALPDRASAVLVVVVGWVSVVVGALTGLLGWLSAAWLTVVPTAIGSGAYLFPTVCQREPGPGGKRRVVGAEVGEEGPSA